MIELQILYCVGVGRRGQIDFRVSCFRENFPHFLQIKLGRSIQFLKGFRNYVFMDSGIKFSFLVN